jgi:hypothetical protein
VKTADILTRTPTLTLRTGVVTAVTTPTCTITLAGATLPGTPHLTTYTPTEGDTVQVLAGPGQLLILGPTAT